MLIFIVATGLAILYISLRGPQISCRNSVQEPCIPESKGKPHPQLSDYHLYKGTLNELNPIDQLVPYNLNTPLFSNYAKKFRMVYVPKGKSVAYNESGILNFPVGSMLVKNFFYDLNDQDSLTKRRIIETRLLIHYDQGWEAETYVWNDAQTSARLEQSGDIKKVSWINAQGIERKINYVIPTKNDCKTCHSNNGELLPLGPKVRNLNKTYSYPTGKQNQLIHWQKAGILTGVPGSPDIPKLPVWDDPATGTINERARAYLDVNCAHCHRKGGVAGYTSFFLTLEEKNPAKLGICKSPVAAGSGSGGRSYDIVPCKPKASIMVYRMNTNKPGHRMPELGRTVINKKAVKLIKDWIKNMECASCSKNASN